MMPLKSSAFAMDVDVMVMSSKVNLELVIKALSELGASGPSDTHAGDLTTMVPIPGYDVLIRRSIVT